MQHVQETNLAWLLIDAAKPELNAREQNHVFISVGAGDSFAAIRILLKLIAVKRISLDPSLAQLCATWLEAYALHADHEQLGVLIDGLASTVTDIRHGRTCQSRRACLANRSCISTVALLQVESLLRVECRCRACLLSNTREIVVNNAATELIQLRNSREPRVSDRKNPRS